MKRFDRLFSSVMLCLVGCSAEALDVGSSKSPSPLSAEPTDSAAPPFSADEVARAKLRCTSPHGPAYAPTTLGPFRDRLLATSWYACDGTGTAWTTTGQGIRFAKESADGFQGHFWALGLGDAGALEQLQGLDSEGTYSFEAATASTVTTWYDTTEFSQVWVSPGSQVVQFEDAPVRMRTTGERWYVAIGVGSD